MKREFEQKIGNKNIKIIAQTGDNDSWGVSGICPWCAESLLAAGYGNPRSAATGYFRLLKRHYVRAHKP